MCVFVCVMAWLNESGTDRIVISTTSKLIIIARVGVPRVCVAVAHLFVCLTEKVESLIELWFWQLLIAVTATLQQDDPKMAE